MPMPAQPIYTIPVPEPQLYGRAADIYTEVPMTGEDARWVGGGVTYVPLGCPNVRGVPEDPCVQLTWNAPEGFQNALTFSPFRIEESITCSTLGAWSPEELTQWAKQEARAGYSVALARQVWGGLYGVGQQNLLGATVAEVTIGSDLSVVSALAAVDAALGQRLLGRGLVHMTPDVLVRLWAAQAVMQDLTTGQWLTPTGHRIVADYGYYNSGAGGTAYIFGSGPVYYSTTGWEATQAWKSTHNDYIVYVSAHAVVWFEPCPLVRAQTNAPTLTNFGVG